MKLKTLIQTGFLFGVLLSLSSGANADSLESVIREVETGFAEVNANQLNPYVLFHQIQALDPGFSQPGEADEWMGGLLSILPRMFYKLSPRLPLTPDQAKRLLSIASGLYEKSKEKSYADFAPNGMPVQPIVIKLIHRILPEGLNSLEKMGIGAFQTTIFDKLHPDLQNIVRESLVQMAESYKAPQDHLTSGETKTFLVQMLEQLGFTVTQARDLEQKVGRGALNDLLLRSRDPEIVLRFIEARSSEITSRSDSRGLILIHFIRTHFLKVPFGFSSSQLMRLRWVLKNTNLFPDGRSVADLDETLRVAAVERATSFSEALRALDMDNTHRAQITRQEYEVLVSGQFALTDDDVISTIEASPQLKTPIEARKFALDIIRARLAGTGNQMRHMVELMRTGPFPVDDVSILTQSPPLNSEMRQVKMIQFLEREVLDLDRALTLSNNVYAATRAILNLASLPVSAVEWAEKFEGAVGLMESEPTGLGASLPALLLKKMSTFMNEILSTGPDLDQVIRLIRVLKRIDPDSAKRVKVSDQVRVLAGYAMDRIENADDLKRITSEIVQGEESKDFRASVWSLANRGLARLARANQSAESLVAAAKLVNRSVFGQELKESFSLANQLLDCVRVSIEEVRKFDRRKAEDFSRRASDISAYKDGQASAAVASVGKLLSEIHEARRDQPQRSNNLTRDLDWEARCAYLMSKF